MAQLRKLVNLAAIEALVAGFNELRIRSLNRLLSPTIVADGTTDGKLKTTAATTFSIGGAVYTKAITDDLWALGAETNTAALVYRAYWLYLDAALAASIVAGTGAASAALAINALPALDATKCPIGVYVAGPETDFDGAAGLASFGTIHQGVPALYTTTGDTITLVAP